MNNYDYLRKNITNEEYVPLIISFNDIFVSIAILLLLTSLGLLGFTINKFLSPIFIAPAAWLLAEVFTRKKRMALPSVLLSLAFSGGIFFSIIITSLFDNDVKIDWTKTGILVYAVGAFISSVASYFYWKRFYVPITIAIVCLFLVLGVFWLLIYLFPSMVDFANVFLFISGLLVLYLAITWDRSDPARVTSKSEIAFWLHLMAASAITHPFFKLFSNDTLSCIVTLLSFFVLIIIALILDRRALIVSSLIYALWALYMLVNDINTNLRLALTFLFMGISILLLSVFWHQLRNYIMILIKSI